MNLNPEFQRNVWLELTRHRLLVTPAILAALFFLVTLLEKNATEAVQGTAIGLFFLFALWAVYLSGDSVVSEIKHRTWDIQKMSAIGPWSMTWGKLIGSSIFPWYGGVLCLVVALATGGDPMWLIILVLATVYAQAIAMLASLLVAQKRQVFDRSAALSHLFAGVLVAGPILLFVTGDKTISWFDQSFVSSEFALVSLLMWGFWGIVGAYRQMSAELRVANPPVAWVGFLLFVCVYVAGFVPSTLGDAGTVWTARLFVALPVVLTMTYGALFADRHDLAALRRLLALVRQRNWPVVLQGLPLWVPALAVTVVVSLALVGPLAMHPLADHASFDEFKEVLKGWQVGAWLMGILLFVVRDAAIVLFFHLGPRKSRADMVALLYLGILYLLVPGILAALDWKQAAALFFPWITVNPLLGMVAGGLQAAGAVCLVVRRWRQGFEMVKTRSMA